jgi:hypothetical protein
MINIPSITMLSDIGNATSAELKVYTAADVLLGTIPLASPAGVVTEDSTHYILTLSATTSATAVSSGTATKGKIVHGSLDRCTFDITATGGGGGFTMPSTTVYSGGAMSITSSVIKIAK